MRVEELAERIIDYRGKTPPKTSSGVPLITAKVIKGGRILQTSEYISEETYGSWMRRGFPQQWDMLLTTEAPLGEVALLRTHERIALAQRVILIRGRKDVVDQRFLAYSFQSPLVQGRLQERATGTTVLGIKQSELRQVDVPLPPIGAQRKVVAVLAAYDELIENNLRRIEILEEMARAVYREWFVNFRFPGHEDTPLVDSPLGPIPDGWSVEKLVDRVELAYGKALKADDRRGGDVPVYGSSGVVGWHDKSLVDGPGIVVGRKGNVGAVHWVDTGFFPIDTTFYVVSDLPLRYLVHNLQQQHFINSDAAVPGLNRNQAYDNPLVVPSEPVLEAFADLAGPVGSLVRNLQSQNENLRSTRDLLLPKLVSGEVDVSELEIETEWLAS